MDEEVLRRIRMQHAQDAIDECDRQKTEAEVEAAKKRAYEYAHHALRGCADEPMQQRLI